VCVTQTQIFKSAEHINTLLCVAADTTSHQCGLEARLVCGRSRAVLTNFEAVKYLSALNSW